jgi:NAD-dependent dihydropyrimidine dehydrogenase PreA subunit
MRRATVNFWIDAVIAVAFLISAFTGILFLLPMSWRSVSAAGGAAMLGVSIKAWHTLHDWSGIVAAVGVIVHAALHLRWFLNMARRIARGKERVPERAATQSLPASSARAPAVPARTPVTPVREPAPAAAAVVAASASGDDRRVSRRAFVVGLGTAVGTAAVLGVGALLRSDVTSAAGAQLADAQNGNGWQGDASGNGWQGGGSSQSDGSGSAGTTGNGQLVVVDSAACVGCGRCLDVCPYGVFAWNGGTAVARDPGACRLCRHCVQVCPAAAITLNG